MPAPPASATAPPSARRRRARAGARAPRASAPSDGPTDDGHDRAAAAPLRGAGELGVLHDRRTGPRAVRRSSLLRAAGRRPMTRERDLVADVLGERLRQRRHVEDRVVQVADQQHARVARVPLPQDRPRERRARSRCACRRGTRTTASPADAAAARRGRRLEVAGAAARARSSGCPAAPPRRPSPRRRRARTSCARRAACAASGRSSSGRAGRCCPRCR